MALLRSDVAYRGDRAQSESTCRSNGGLSAILRPIPPCGFGTHNLLATAKIGTLGALPLHDWNVGRPRSSTQPAS